MKKQIKKLLEDINQYKVVDHVDIVAVTKTKSITLINDLLKEYPFSILGENSATEIRDKYDSHAIKNVEWHMIGRVQSNKIKYLVGRVSLIHSVASMELLAKINDEALKKDCEVAILIQVNPSQETSKQGLNKQELDDLMLNVQSYSKVVIKGLMCMAPLSEDQQVINETFRQANQWFKQYQSTTFNTLSMGMSNDYQIALLNGANMIRVGSLLFEE
ncbi:MAG: YggS family pyridoxal phosphate-dependent enzyme [Bacilli bacterium]